MKSLYLFLCSMLVLTPLQGMQQRQRQSCCSKLSLLASKTTSWCGILAYKATSWCGRNDYLYLAYADSLWYMQKKLQSKEQIKDINRYYLRYGATFNTTNSRFTNACIYVSPLHEAVQRGHLAAVMLLCNAGADKTLTIKSRIENSEAAEQCYAGCVFMGTDALTEEEVQQKIAEWNKSNNVGLSAPELAEELLKKESRKNCDLQRRYICQFLRDGHLDI